MPTIRDGPHRPPRDAPEVRVRALGAGAELRKEEGQLRRQRRCKARFKDSVLVLCLVPHCWDACGAHLL